MRIGRRRSSHLFLSAFAGALTHPRAGTASKHRRQRIAPVSDHIQSSDDLRSLSAPPGPNARLPMKGRPANEDERPWPCPCFYGKGVNRMKINLRNWVLAAALGVAITGSAVQAIAAPLFQELDQQQHEQDYSKNKVYQQGVREGKDDSAHNRDHSKKRHFKKDEDRKAYEAGYQKGHSN